MTGSYNEPLKRDIEAFTLEFQIKHIISKLHKDIKSHDMPLRLVTLDTVSNEIDTSYTYNGEQISRGEYIDRLIRGKQFLGSILIIHIFNKDN